MTLKLPYDMGSYRLVQRIAVGGMAEIFLAEELTQSDFRGPLVVKLLHRHLCESDTAQASFDTEAQILESINHEAFVQLVDSGTHDGRPYLVFPRVDGQPLRELSHLEPKRVIQICAELCDALHHLHTETKMAHCDVSPANILISSSGQVKVTDFGISQPLGQSALHQELHANLAYMSPEQARQQVLTSKSDLFSVGIIMWEMLTGTNLFLGQNDFETINNVLKLELINPCQVNPELSADYGELTLKFLSRDVTLRPNDCATAADTLRALERPREGYEKDNNKGHNYTLVVGFLLVVTVLAGYFFLRS